MYTPNYKNILVKTYCIEDKDYMSPGTLVAYAEIKKATDKQQAPNKVSLSKKLERIKIKCFVGDC
jgi:hypothetical protein